MKVKEHAIGEETGGEEYLAFTLGSEEYGIDILKVQELRGYETITRIANAPEFIKGVINLRGIIVPIADLRIKFQLDRVEYNQYTVVIILNLTDRVVGIAVDGVSDVLTLQSQQIKPAPQFSGALDTEYIRGLGSIDERMLILVDIERLLMSADIALCDEVAGEIA